MLMPSVSVEGVRKWAGDGRVSDSELHCSFVITGQLDDDHSALSCQNFSISVSVALQQKWEVLKTTAKKYTKTVLSGARSVEICDLPSLKF